MSTGLSVNMSALISPAHSPAPSPVPSPTPEDDDDDRHAEQVARRILDDLEFDLDMDDMYDLDLHWQSEPVDYGRMTVRRLSQELAGVGAALTRRPSVDLQSGSGLSSTRSFVSLSRRSSADLGGSSLVDGSASLREWTRKSLSSRRMSMDPTMFGRASRMDRRLSDDVKLDANGIARRYSHGTIDELPEVSKALVNRAWKTVIDEAVMELEPGSDQEEEEEEDEEEEYEQRRGGISFEKTDKNALYVRMLGDVKVQTKPVISRERRRSSLLDSDLRMLENMDLSQYKMRRGHKFYSLHQVRRRARSSFRQLQEHTSILDEHYGGQARCLLSTVGDWHFNVFSLDKLTNGRSLFHMALHMFQEYDLINKFQLDIVKLMRCFTLIEEGYHSNNPYHNAVHAADVGQAMHCFLRESKLAKTVTPLEVMIALLAAFTHDLDHPGVNQTFLISTSNHLAALYKNSSVLENHHWRSAVCVINESGVFSHLDPQTFSTIECQIRSLILATDITRQQEFLNQFKRQLETNELDLTKADHRHFTLQIVLKCADICNPCRPWDVSKRWSEQICDEFFQQGDYERQLQLSVTPNCDRYKTTVAKIQSGFIQYVVSPLFTEWNRFNPTSLSHTMLNNMHQNKALWDGIIAKAEAADSPHCRQEVSSSEEEDEQAVDSSCKENININVNVHCADVPEDTVLEDRFDSPCRSDEYILEGCVLRRHSLPPPALQKDLAGMAGQRRGSLPKLKLAATQNGTRGSSRRHSLPVSVSNAQHTAALDRLAEKLVSLAEREQLDELSKTQSVADILLQRPKITNLSADIEATFRLSSLSAVLAERTAANTGTGQAGRSSCRHKIPYHHHHHHHQQHHNAAHKEVTFELPCPLPTANSGTAPSGPSRQSSSTARQVLRPLNTNLNQAVPQTEGRPRGRSGSAEFSNLRPRHLNGVLFERPRSLSLEHDSQPLLRSIGEWRTFTVDDEPNPVDNYSAAPSDGYCEPQHDVSMTTGHMLEEESLTTPLLGDHHPHSSRSSHLSAT